MSIRFFNSRLISVPKVRCSPTDIPETVIDQQKLGSQSDGLDETECIDRSLKEAGGQPKQ